MIRTIALVDWNWTGHHATYFRYFASAIADNDVRVVSFCPRPDELRETLHKQDESGLPVNWDNVEPPLGINIVAYPKIRPSRFRPKLWAINQFRMLAKTLRAWERTNKSKIDLVFFACIYDSQFAHFGSAERFFGYPWSGLYLHARGFRMPGSVIPFQGQIPCPEKIFTLQSMHSVALIDEGALEPMQLLNRGKPTLVFPDITETAVPVQSELSSGLAKKVRNLASGRPIISLVGHLQRTKGLLEFSRAAIDRRLADCIFLLAGPINWMEIDQDTREEMIGIWESAPNVLTHFFHLSEQTLNAVIAESQLVYAAYTDFPNSSNIQIKAAALGRPILVSDGYLMAERNHAYNLGEVAREGDLESIVKAIERVVFRADASADRSPLRENFAAKHSYGHLVQAFSDLINV